MKTILYFLFLSLFLVTSCKKNNEEFNDNCQIISGKFSDETREQLMLIQKDGTWKIVSFEKNKWIELFKGKVEEWVSKNSKSSFHFIEKDRRILCIKENLISKNSDYFMHSFLPFGTLKSAFQNNDNKGLLNSMDTLKTTDFYISLKAGIIRLNRDWRFDLKEIIFNEKGFVINNTIDFTAYTADQNPKFYESSVIVPGNYFEPLKPALMVLSGNKKKDILPDVLQFFKVE